MKKWTVLMGLLAMALTVPAAADEPAKEAEPIKTEVAEIDQAGNLQLTITGTDFLKDGFDYGDLVVVNLNNKEFRMPVVKNYSDVDQGAMLCKISIKPEKKSDKVDLAVNMGNLAEYAGLAVREDLDGDPGYRWNLNEGITEPIPVTVSLLAKGGYDDQLQLHQLTGSDNREDYPKLDDEAFANFREITTTGMGDHVLYRSSSPVNPKISRNKEADAACREHGIKTIVNMADSDKTMSSYEGYDSTYYSTCNIDCLNMVVDYGSDSFKESLANGFTFIAGQEGPYLLHCTEGKDRTGFACAVLESFMGADADEVIKDYMLSFENFYGIDPSNKDYSFIADANIKKILANAFGLDTIEGADLAAAAEAYLKDLGLSDETLSALKEKLGGAQAAEVKPAA